MSCAVKVVFVEFEVNNFHYIATKVPEHQAYSI